MKSILFLSSELPYPPFSGGRLKSWKLVEFLGEHYDLSVGCILKGTDEEFREEFLSHAKLGDFFSAPVKIPRNAVSLLISYLKGVPLNLYRTYSRQFEKTVREKAALYDILFIDHYEVFQYVPGGYPGFVVLHTHNAEYVMWDRFAREGGNPAKRIGAFWEAKRIKRKEAEACSKSHLVLAAPNDIESFMRIGVDRSKCRVTYHLGDDSQLALPSLDYGDTEMALMNMGTLNWEANVDGLLWFFGDVWPVLKKTHPDLKFYVIGKDPDQRLVNAARDETGIVFTGFIKDPEPYFRKSRVFVAPVRFGSGIKVKILNAMCRGIPTVTTSAGIEGLDVEHMKHIAVADDAEQMKASVSRLLTDRAAWEQLERHSRTLINEKYTWKKLFSDMKQELDRGVA